MTIKTDPDEAWDVPWIREVLCAHVQECSVYESQINTYEYEYRYDS
jgi:hypothetical protein